MPLFGGAGCAARSPMVGIPNRDKSTCSWWRSLGQSQRRMDVVQWRHLPDTRSRQHWQGDSSAERKKCWHRCQREKSMNTKSNFNAGSGCQARLVRRLAPRTRWTRLPGPPSQGMSSVWENINGDRVHCGGLLRMANGTCVNWCDPRYRAEMRLAEIMQPSRRRIRSLLLWAELILYPTNK